MVEAAAELFLERGFEGTSVGDIVKRSGGSLATLYSWFGSKEGLFEAIAEQVSEQIVATFDAPNFESLPLDEALQEFGERFLHMILCPNALRWHRICAAEGEKFPELRNAFIRGGAVQVQGRLAGYFAAQAAAGRLEIDDPAAAALQFFSLLKSETHLAAVCGEPIDASPEDVVRQVHRAVHVFLYGYIPRASQEQLSSPGNRRPRRRSIRS